MSYLSEPANLIVDVWISSDVPLSERANDVIEATRHAVVLVLDCANVSESQRI